MHSCVCIICLTSINWSVVDVVQFTKKEADKLRLVGYVMNSHDGSVIGTVQGPEDKVVEM